MKIFLSYALADREWTNELASELRSEGIEVSSSDNGWRLDDNSGEALRQSMQSADLVIPVITSHSLNSPKALFEWGAVLTIKKPVLPLLITQKDEQLRPPFRWADHLSVQAASPQEAAEQIAEHASKMLAVA